MDFFEIVGAIFGILFGIAVLMMLFAVPISAIRDRRYKAAVTADRLEQENQLLKDEITRLKQDNEELSKKNKQALAEIKAKDVLIYNLGLDFSNQDDSFLIPPHLLGAYMKSLCTERLEKAFIDEVYFQSLSAIVLSSEEKVIPSTPEEENEATTYHTTLTECSCDDCQKGHAVCKHMLALALHVHALTPYKRVLGDLLSRSIEQNQRNAELLKEIKKSNEKQKKSSTTSQKKKS